MILIKETNFVTSSYARFSSGLVVSHYPCQIVRLACISFAWRTHVTSSHAAINQKSVLLK